MADVESRPATFRELSLFTGAGGGVLASKLLGWTTVGYVEIDDYCQQIIAQRIEDGIFCPAPIFGDIGWFNRSGYAEAYTGMVDVVSAGFPCQPFSVAGSQAGEDDHRNMWPETLATILTVRPRYAFLENVPGLLAHKYFGRILGDLAEGGYDCRYRVLSAAELGAPHMRDRLWIVANASEQGLEGWSIPSGSRAEHADIGAPGWWETEPDMDRVANGVANRVDRLKAVGNGQVPAVAAEAWRLLTSVS